MNDLSIELLFTLDMPGDTTIFVALGVYICCYYCYCYDEGLKVDEKYSLAVAVDEDRLLLLSRLLSLFSDLLAFNNLSFIECKKSFISFNSQT